MRIRTHLWVFCLIGSACGSLEPVDVDPRPTDAGALPPDLLDASIGLPDGDVERPPSCLEFEPDYYFYEVTLGRTELLRITVRNVCPGVRTVLGARLDRLDGPFALDPAPYPVSLDPGGLERFTVRFAPLELGEEEGLIVFETDDERQRQFRVRVHGTGSGGSLRSLPPSLGFETVPLGCDSSTRAVAVLNEGPGPMWVTSITLAGADAGAFELSAPPVLPTEVDVGEVLFVNLRFAPVREGDHEARLELEYNGRPNPERVPIRGKSEPGRSRTESFEQAEQPKLDLLFLVPDISEDDAIASALYDLLDRLSARGLDYHLAMAPLGTREIALGQIRACPGFSPILGSTLDDAELRRAILRCMISKNRLQWIESGVGAAQRAVERSLFGLRDSRLNPNAELLRAGSRLEIIAPGRDDRWFVPLEAVLAFFDRLRSPRFEGWRFHASGRPFSGLCAMPESRYAKLVQATQGAFTNTCNPDWDAFFASVEARLNERRRRFSLDAYAQADTVGVVIDGQRVASSSVSWSFEPEDNAVWFAPNAAPSAGSRVQIGYDVRCE